MARRQWFWLRLLVLATLLICSQAVGSEPPATTTDCELPTPPQQKAAWTPPRSKLPAKFVTAAANLFQLGLADPRGCEYREIVLARHGSVASSLYLPEGRDKTIKCNGWVLPTTTGTEQRFAICWNGVVVPLASIGPVADVRHDVLNAIKSAPSKITDPEIRPDVGPLSAALLLRLGQTELAETVWTQFTRRSTAAQTDATEDIYLEIAYSWRHALEDEAWDAHMSGNDRLALSTVKLLVRSCDAIESEAKRRGTREFRELPEDGKPSRFLSESDPVRALLADQEMRAARRSQGRSPTISMKPGEALFQFQNELQAKLKQRPNKEARISLLIDLLAEASFEMGGRTSDNLIAAMLVNEGDSAIEPLLACMRTDTRLTRIDWTLGPHSMAPEHAIIPVRDLAFDVAESILHAEFYPFLDHFSFMQPETGKGDPELLKAAIERWRPYKGLPPAEMWYRILADDTKAECWLAAAQSIVDHRDPSAFANSIDNVPPLPGAPRQKQFHAGEALRGKSHPSVTELIARRVKDLNDEHPKWLAKRTKLADQMDKLNEQSDEPGNEKTAKLRENVTKQLEELESEEPDISAIPTSELALCLAEWDPKAALPALKEMTARCRREIVDSPSKHDLYVMVARLTLQRALAGDEQSLDDYAEWIRGVGPGEFWNDQRGLLLVPLWRTFGESGIQRESIQATAQRLFQSPDSAWNPAIRLRHEVVTTGENDWMIGPLVTSKPFRQQLAEVLKDKTEVGYAEVHSPQDIFLNLATSTSTAPDDPLLPLAGSKMSFRLCDLCAYRLSQLEGAPRCELYWPVENRDKAVAACADYLSRYGGLFRVPGEPVTTPNGKTVTLGSVPYAMYWRDHTARLTLNLNGNRPARVGEESVFSLVPKDLNAVQASNFARANIRTVLSHRLPLRAVWTKLKSHPYYKDEWNAKNGKWTKSLAYQQTGTVWQAEELRSGNSWKRYFGFVGRHCFAKVPAEEIDFPWDEWPVAQIGPHLKAAMIADFSERSEPMFRLGKPMFCKLRVQNHTGLDRELPPLVEKRPGAVVPAGGFVFEIHLEYTATQLGQIAAFDEMLWKSVPRKAGTSFTLRRPAGALDPAAQFDVVEIDLSRYFDITEAGTYELWVTCAPSGETPKSKPEPTNHDYVSFLIADPLPQVKATTR
jgi:hypothetical protein